MVVQMRKTVPLIILVLILSILVSGCLKQAETDLTNAKTLYDKQLATPTPTPTITATPTPNPTASPTPTINIINANDRERRMIINALNNTDKDIIKHISIIRVIDAPNINNCRDYTKKDETGYRTIACYEFNSGGSGGGDAISLIPARYYDAATAYSDRKDYVIGTFETTLYYEMGMAVSIYKNGVMSNDFALNYSNDFITNHHDKLVEP
jgi:hypothetical protein